MHIKANRMLIASKQGIVAKSNADVGININKQVNK